MNNIRYPEEYYLNYNPDECGREDIDILHSVMRLLKTQKPHECSCGNCGNKLIKTGSIALREKVIIKGVGRRSYYYDIECINRWIEGEFNR